MINKQLNEIGLDDLNSLIKSSVLEGKTIEYKEKLPGNSDTDRKEFLADISSFANTSGGDLVFGIASEKGLPKEIVGLEISNVDAEKLKYEEIVRNGLEPKINFTIHTVPITSNKFILIFRMNKSWLGPHRVIYKGHDKFYGRNSAGKYPLDTGELKIAFNLSETLNEKVSRFKAGRIIQLAAGNTPLPFYGHGKIVLHLVPIESFSPESRVDLNSIIKDLAKLEPIYSYGWSNRINLEGVLSYTIGKNTKSHTYVQLYRNGIIEAVEGLILTPGDDKKFIPSITYERELIKYLDKYLNVLRGLNVNPPLTVFLTFIGVKGFKMAVDPSRIMFEEHYEIDRDILELPEALLDSYDIDPRDVLKPMFDLIWNACGYERSLNFDDKGNWIAK